LTVSSSDGLAARLDEVQYGQDEGPCLHTLRTGEVTVVDDLAHEDRWRSYVAHALGHGARSSLSLPLTVNGGTRGALNIYARVPGAFGTTERQRAEIFARQASAALTVVTRQAEQTQLTEQLRAALATRAVIDQALGILMAQQHCRHDEAFAILRGTSQHQNRKLRDVAAEIVESVTGEPTTPPRFNDPA
jgi:GAF domain-containing protein